MVGGGLLHDRPVVFLHLHDMILFLHSRSLRELVHCHWSKNWNSWSFLLLLGPPVSIATQQNAGGVADL
jgi:hypothetical protein